MRASDHSADESRDLRPFEDQDELVLGLICEVETAILPRGADFCAYLGASANRR